MECNYRHEFKYLISDIEIEILKNRIKNFVPLDQHVDENGFYNISSLYFDDIYDRCFYENENGTDPREKFRIRIYNHETDRISLECKRKERGKTLKTSCLISQKQVEQILNGESIRDIKKQEPLIQKFTEQMLSRQLRPKVIVEYDRIPYVYKAGNVRITFDRNLSSSRDVGNFLTGNASKRPVMPVGIHLMEVKYDEFLPGFIKTIIQSDNMTQTAYSKYYLCRKYDMR